MPVLATNKRANYDYELLDKYEAGLVLFGHEVKAARQSQVSLKGSYITIRTINGRPELFLVNCHISPYKHAGSLADYDPARERKLLLKRGEISHLLGKKKSEGLTLIPTKIYTKHSFLKLEFAAARGKKKYDKRETIKKREEDKRLRALAKKR